MASKYTGVWVFILSRCIDAVYSENSQCSLDKTELDGIRQAGDIVIGIIITLHLDSVYHHNTFTERPPWTTCTTFGLGNYQQLQAVIFAIEEINRSRELLPNITLGFQAYDSCLFVQHSITGLLQVVTGQTKAVPNYRCLEVPLGSVIGHTSSTHSILMAHILGLLRYPQISHFSTSPLLSDRTKFPSFFRTIPSDVFQSKGLAQMVLHFGWTWIGLLALDNDYGQQGIQLVRQEIIKAGACIAFSETMILSQPDRNAPRIVNTIKQSSARVVVVFSKDIDLFPILVEMVRQDVTQRIFVACETLSTSQFFQGMNTRLVLGTIGLAVNSGTIPGFKDYLNKVHPSKPSGGTWAKILWEKTFNCKFTENNITSSLTSPLKLCTGAEDLESITNSYNDVDHLRVTYNAYTAVQIIAMALEDLRSCQSDGNAGLHWTCADLSKLQPWKLLNYIKRTRIRLSSGQELYFDKNGDPPAVYDIVNWQLGPDDTIKHIKVGSYDTTRFSDEVFHINTSIIQWPNGNQMVPLSVCSESCPPGFRKATRRGQPVCCFQCVPCPQGEISNQTDALDCLKCPWDQWPNLQKSSCLPKAIEFLSYEDPLGLTLTVTTVTSSLVPTSVLLFFINYKNSPIVKANNYHLSCFLLFSLTLCFLCSLAFIGLPQTEKCLLRQCAFGIVFTLCVSCILAKTMTVVFAFMATKPGSRLKKWTTLRVSFSFISVCSIFQLILCIIWVSLAPPFPQYVNTEIQLISYECNEGSTMAFWSMLGYLGLLASISFIVAFMARRLPDSFNEAKFITFSMLAFLSVWVSFIPAYLSAQGKYTAAMEVFAILCSSWALVICMFLPKCFIILFRPNMNSREYLVRKARFLFETYQQFQALRFAVEEINRNPEVLPNITLGFVAYDSCSALYKELEGTLGMITGQNHAIPNYLWLGKPPLAAILGHSMSTYSILMAHILGLYRYPQISHYATSSRLSDRSQFPSFFRTVPSDAFQSQGLAQLVLHFGWTWVGMVGMGNDYGQQGMHIITQEILKAGACVAFTEFIHLNRADRNAPHITRIIEQSTAKVIIMFSIDIFFIPILDEMIRQNITGKIFIASEAWSISSVLLVDKYTSLLSGSLGFAYHSSTIPGFKAYLKNIHPFKIIGKMETQNFWEMTFSCKFLDHNNLVLNGSSKVCSGNETLETVENVYTDASNLRTSYNIYTSAHVVAQALQNLQSCQEKKGPFNNRSCANLHNFTPWQVER
ncbi:extracellular calcium-sensing receptor-like [Hyla sarda]|uniref:extracellular calcium-sensing receptor-like n=1 Tax=Hyla sarda TaxID=327740 RepID=UPI0024C40803|nr:extracellular calcium-sensing receptor-like [Hyla sarda]